MAPRRVEMFTRCEQIIPAPTYVRLKSKKNLTTKKLGIRKRCTLQIREIFEAVEYACLRLLPSRQTECRKLNKTANITTCVEPLEKTPYEAKPKVLQKPTDLHPIMGSKFSSLGSITHHQGMLDPTTA
jgi:hypothetical protein